MSGPHAALCFPFCDFGLWEGCSLHFLGLGVRKALGSTAPTRHHTLVWLFVRSYDSEWEEEPLQCPILKLSCPLNAHTPHMTETTLFVPCQNAVWGCVEKLNFCFFCQSCFINSHFPVGIFTKRLSISDISPSAVVSGCYLFLEGTDLYKYWTWQFSEYIPQFKNYLIVKPKWT